MGNYRVILTNSLINETVFIGMRDNITYVD